MLCGLAAPLFDSSKPPCRSFPRPAADPSRPLHNHSHDAAHFHGRDATSESKNLNVLIGIELVAAQDRAGEPIDRAGKSILAFTTISR
jgi:hypothetical protein